MTDSMGRTYWACERLKSHKGLDGRWQVPDERDAVLISSLASDGLHAPCLDFDFPGMVVPRVPPGRAPSWLHVMSLSMTRSWSKLAAALAVADLVDDTSVYDNFAGHDVCVHSLAYKVPVRAVPSSDPYKHHLYVDALITWTQYVPIIEALRDLALLEFNFAKFSLQREMTMLLRPGLKKADLKARGVVIEEHSDGTWNTTDLNIAPRPREGATDGEFNP